MTMGVAQNMLDRISKALPEDYGKIHINLPCIDKDSSGRVGVVIPSYRRPEYVEVFLKSLAKADLKNTVLCFVDESETDVVFDEYPGYRLYKSLDSPGNDLNRDQQCYNLPLAKIKKRCDNDNRCQGFNSLGYLKSKIRPSGELKDMSDSVCGLYVKENVAKALGMIKEPAPPTASGAETAVLIKEFEMASVPMIKIFKRKHGNMFESLRLGWDLLKDILACEYLCCLDSDTVVRKDWLIQLRRIYRLIAQKMSHPNFLLTGFNADSHRILEEHDRYYIKASVGGANLFYSSRIYSALRPSLHHIFWDHEMVNRIRLLKGKFFCVRPSVVQHIGKQGLWSGRTYDVALDFQG
ncbi:MAG: hypothetical protein WCA08_25840 [Desulfoferrobacter sp.]